MIDPELALGHELPAVTTSWTVGDVLLYHLALGAGRDRPTDAGELRYVFEDGVVVLPTFAAVLGTKALRDPTAAPGLAIDLGLLLHGEHEIRLHGPIPPAGTVVSTARVAEIWDKGKHAVVVFEIDSALPDGTPLFTNRHTMFCRGEGGFGGVDAPRSRSAVPERPVDVELEIETTPNQALIYRLCGDKNPLHVDPDAAKRAGFEQPILHGLCTFGVTAKAVVDEVLAGETTRVRAFGVRFAGVVFPGETLVTSVWREGDRLFLDTAVGNRRVPALSHGFMELSS